MRITVLYDNTVYRQDLTADWGFSCLVEIPPQGGTKILFDTGTKGSVLLSNMDKLNIDPRSIDEVFISHAHFDHVGGLSAFLNVKSDVTIYVPRSISGVHGVNRVVSVSEPLKIYEDVFSTGELDSIEQSMAVKTDKGAVLIVGCSHPKMAHILEAASQFGKVYAIVGGLHGFSDFDLFRDLDLIYPAHCTQHKAKIRSLFPEKYIDGGVGKIIVL